LLQSVAVCCRVLQCVAECEAQIADVCVSTEHMLYSVLQCASTSRRVRTTVTLVLESVAMCCSVLQCVAECELEIARRCEFIDGTHGNLTVLRCIAVCCSVLQIVKYRLPMRVPKRNTSILYVSQLGPLFQKSWILRGCCVCVCLCVHVCMCVCVYIHQCLHVFLYTYTYIYDNVHKYI